MAVSARPAGAAWPDGWPANPYADTEQEARTLRACQLLAIGGGAASLGSGTVLLGWPGPTLPVVAGVLGGWLLVSGALRLAESVAPGGAGAARHLPATAGLIQLVAGVVSVRGLLVSPELLAVVAGLAGLAGGVAETVPAATGTRGGWARSGALASGLLGVLGGLVLAFWPGLTPPALALAAGGWLLALGAVQVALAIRAGRPAAAP